MAKTLVALIASLCIAFSAVAAQSKPAAKKAPKPEWSELTAAQKQVLAPLEPEWNQLDTTRRKKWVSIADRYPTMKPAEQKRLAKRMQEWAKLTPEERRAARERYKTLRKLPPQERKQVREKWQEYQQSVTPEPAPAAPAAPAPAAAETPPPTRLPAANEVPASLARRLAALVYEALLLAAVLWCAALPFQLIEVGLEAPHVRLLFQVYLALVSGVYFIAQWRRGGQTLPMKTWRLRLVGADGSALSVRQATLRYVVALAGLLLAGVGFLWALFDRDGNYLHDRIARTRIVQVPKEGR